MADSSDSKTAADSGSESDTPRPATAPESISVSLGGFDTEEHARAFGNLLAMYVRELSRQIDLSALDGITVAFDYAQALLDLDRGYATTRKLTPSDGLVYGVAMTLRSSTMARSKVTCFSTAACCCRSKTRRTSSMSMRYTRLPMNPRMSK
jgi:hypothetical protein